MTSSFIICTKDRAADLKYCLESIITQTILPYEVIIVDASSDDISFENNKNCEAILSEKIKLHFLRSEPSTTRQRNIGIEIATGDIVFFLDDDVILEHDYHERILDVYELKKGQNIGGVRGSLNNYNEVGGTSWLELVFRKIFFMRRDMLHGKSRTLPSFNPVEILKPDKIIAVEFMPTCMCSYYREILKDNKFDEVLDRYALAEDWDLSYRVSRKYNLFQTPFALLRHELSPVSRLRLREFRKKQAFNMHYLAKKHIPPGSIKWIAYYWSLLGRMIFLAVKGVKTFNFDEVAGFWEGFKYIKRSMS